MKFYNYCFGCMWTLIGGMLLTSCGGEKKTGMPGAGAVKDYKVETITLEHASLHTDFPANIQGQQVVEIRPKIDGFVEKIYVDEGATVKKGQLLFRISNPQYEQEVRTAEAGIKTAQAEVSSAELQVNKVKPLVEKGIISKFEQEAAEYALQAKRAALAQANATLANARTNVGYTAISSPVNGIIGNLPNKVGALVSSNSAQPLTTVSESGNVLAYFSLNEKQLLNISRIYKGATLQDKLKGAPEVQLILADGTVYDQKGRIETGSGLVSSETGTLSFRAVFPNPVGILRSGGSGSVRIPREIDSAIVIPQVATYDLQGKRFAWLVKQDTTVTSVALTVRPMPDGQSFVVEDGLKVGDVIVVEGITDLKEGAKIRTKK
ncbi:efflux RND transporter periplasmic adaptor subunit [uncultured Chitinophaga sp.]|uniref:efflux RND transporter periplasmic adaptor subunit n=1 Tax=uncultured Chitinophaga sp. TaxID=339340 RepID=UPI0025ED4A69|nr:efflux RND transporter periplasmic adaptor subunit [uncultured Chitinophaga sp.]